MLFLIFRQLALISIFSAGVYSPRNLHPLVTTCTIEKDLWLSISRRLEISNLRNCHEHRFILYSHYYTHPIYHLYEHINAKISSSDKSNAVYLFSKINPWPTEPVKWKISTYPPERNSSSIDRHLLGLLMYPELRKAENPASYVLCVRP